MSGNRDNRSLRRVLTTALTTVLIIIGPSVADTSPQQPPAPQRNPATTSGADARTSVPPPLRAAASNARRVLESALTGDDSPARWLGLYAARQLRQPWIAAPLIDLCDSPDLTERVLALEAVTNSNPAKGKSAFAAAIDSEHRSIRLRGVLGLMALRDTSMAPELVTIMLEDEDPDLRAAAARALGEIGAVTASIPLYESVMESQYAPVREQAVLALMALGDEQVGVYLVEQLKSDRGPGEEELLKLLALIPDPDLIPDLTPYLEHDYLEIRIQAAATILSILEKTRPARP